MSITTFHSDLYMYVCFLLIIAVLIIIVYIWLNSINKNINKKNKDTKDEINKLNSKVNDISENSEKVTQINKQINDKSEVISKIMEQTNDIYREMLKIEKESKSDISLSPNNNASVDFFQKDKANALPGEHLSDLITTINNPSEEKRKEIQKASKNIDIHLSNDDLTEQEVLDLIHNLQDYENILSEELKYYLNEINLINENKDKLDAKERLEKKEAIYTELKITQEKIEEQEQLMKKILIYKVEFDAVNQEQEKIKNEENKLDSMIADIINKR